MSLSFRRRDHDGRVHHYFIPFHPTIVVVSLTVLLGFVLSGWMTFRVFVRESPHLVVPAIVLTFVFGLALVAAAKLSVVRRWQPVSFGPKLMSSPMRRCYFIGVIMMGVACLLAAFLAAAI